MPHSTYFPERMGRAEVSPSGAFEAGSFQSFVLTYTAGFFGIDDTGSIKVVHRFASDMGRPQFTDPAAPNYTTVEASNGAVLDVQYDAKRNIRPWDKTLFIRVVRGFLREGDRIVVRFGDRRGGSPGIRMQTFHEPTFEFRVLVDAWATYEYVELPEQPFISVEAGPPALYKAVLPTLRRRGEPFRLGFKGEDRWGNPSHKVDATFRLACDVAIAGLPATVTLRPGEYARSIEGLRCDVPGDLVVRVLDPRGAVVCTSNPLRIVEEAALLPYWCDLHGQSEETIGTNSAEELIAFARDRAFLDAMSHQGNDFQITTPFWRELNRLTALHNRDGEFVIFPGYEWSGNTGLGGDRNVLFRHEGRPIHRSHHALVEDRTDLASDANTAADLFQAVKDEDCVVFAHIGGRYADIAISHDVRLERSVEVHSDWGTFEWLVEDAFRQGYRVGILANSDGHKGRHGASHPGASLFGAYGGLSCLLARELTRDALFEALRARHHYATTGTRLLLDTSVRFAGPVERFESDPALGPARSTRVDALMMGDIARMPGERARFRVEAVASVPIERIEIRNRLETLATLRPYGREELGRRIRVIWEGAEYRGRGRQTSWDGRAVFEGNAVERIRPINMWNLDKKVEQVDARNIRWSALSTGNFGGFDAWLTNASDGTLAIDTALVKATIPIADIGYEDTVLDAGGIERRIRVFRLPDGNPHTSMVHEREVSLASSHDNALYVRVTLEDGHLAWSSPIYLVP
jgi:hypothetical protein